MKYQEALKEITHLTFVETKYYEMLKKLAEEKDEQESRREKLVVGSEWECIVSHKVFGTKRITFNPKGRTVIITSIIEDLLSYKYQDDKGNDDIEEHFLLCFKPR